VGLHVSGNYAYAANRLTGLTVLDVSNPANPAQVGTVDTPGDATAVQVAGHYAYVADGPGGLRIVDVADPTQPRLVGHFLIPQRAMAVGVAGARAWVIEPNGIHVADVGNPAAPVKVAGLPFGSGFFAQVQFSADRALVAGPQLISLDLANPGQPVPLDGLLARTNNLPIVVWTGPTTFATAGYTWMLTNNSFAEGLKRRFSTNAPRNMAEILENLRRSPYYHQYTVFPGGLQCWHLFGNRVLTVSGGDLQVFDVSEPADPRRIREVKLGISAWDVRGAGRYAYVMDSGANIHVVDLEDVALPRPAARFGARGYASAVLAVRDIGRAATVTPLPAAESEGILMATNAPVLADPKRLSDGSFAFTLRAEAGETYIVQVSEDFASWAALSTNTLPAGGEIRITDPRAAVLPNRSYRAVRMP